MELTYLEAFGTCLELNFWNNPRESILGSWDAVVFYPGSGQTAFIGQAMKIPPRGALRKK